VWNPEKLLWLNQHYLKTLPAEDIARRLLPFLLRMGVEAEGDPRLERVVVALRERSKTLVEMAELARPFFVRVPVDPKAAAKHLDQAGRRALALAREALHAVSSWNVLGVDAAIKAVSETAGVGMGKVAQPVRVAVMGVPISPPIGETLELLGKVETLERIDLVLAS
jgi:glutamyl-tRNA synthetase